MRRCARSRRLLVVLAGTLIGAPLAESADPATAPPPARTLTVADAEALASRRFGVLDLDDVAELPANVAEVLVRYRGRRLSLNGLTTVSDETAAVLATFTGSLSLDGVRELSDPALAALASRPAGVSLGGLVRLSPAGARALAASPSGSVALPALAAVTPEVAAGLAHQNGMLWLDGLSTLPEPVAEALGRHRGLLSLDGLRQLSPEAARHLARHDGALQLRGLRSLPLDVAKPFVRHRSDLMLDGVEELADDVAAALARHGALADPSGDPRRRDGAVARPPGVLSLRGLRSLTSISLARHLVATEQRRAAVTRAGPMIRLDRVERLSTGVAVELAMFEGALHLAGLGEISPAAASALAQHRGGLCLDGIQRLDPAAAAALAEYGVPLPLEGLTSYLETLSRFYSGRGIASGLSDSPLSLQGLRVLDSPALARRFVDQAQDRARRRQGRAQLRLDHVESVSLEVAHVFAAFDGALSLNGLTSPSPEVRAVLAGRRATTELGRPAPD
jgi:hypothetical protein